MSKKISGAEHSLSKIFSSEFEFIIPSYQRPYAWNIDQTSELLDDLDAFHKTEKEEGYFLGSIVLIKSEDKALSEVIDGQQRLTTLTLLLTTIACAHDATEKDAMKAYILEPGKKLEKINPKPRLSLRKRDQEFFEKYIQGFDLHSLLGLDEHSLENESQRKMQANTKYLFEEIEKRFKTAEELQNFATFLLTRCYLVTVSTSSQESAFRVFSVMNSRGLNLQPTDIIKADLIGQIQDEALQQTYTDKWEEMEVELTRSGFNDLFTYVRMIYAKEKAKRSLLEEFRNHVLSKNPNPNSLIDDILRPFADALSDIRTGTFAATKHADDINYYIGWLNRIDNSDWIPPAILFLKKYRNKPDQLLRFFQLFERLVAYMHICCWNVNQRIELYGDLITEIESDIKPDDMDMLNFSPEDINEYRKALDGDIYRLTPRRRNYLILRLDSFISDGAAIYDPKILTIEHVLPQTVAEKSEWASWWPDKEMRGLWVHRLANLVPLNKKRNSAARNYEFSTKCETYFKGKKNVSSYALTSQVLSKKEWTPKTLKARQKELIDILMENWELTS
jgi:hypothetical protein